MPAAPGPPAAWAGRRRPSPRRRPPGARRAARASSFLGGSWGLPCVGGAEELASHVVPVLRVDLAGDAVDRGPAVLQHGDRLGAEARRQPAPLLLDPVAGGAAAQ